MSRFFQVFFLSLISVGASAKIPSSERVDELSLPPIKQTSCPSALSKLDLRDDLDKYHHDGLCNRGFENRYSNSLKRKTQMLLLQEQGRYVYVPEQKTAICPLEPQDWSQTSSSNQPQAIGLNTVWIVENTASTPIVISSVNTQGVEASAVNPRITPAVADPKAIVNPGQFLAVHTHEGHVFYARQVVNMPGGNRMAGPVLLQHRAGMIPIGADAEDLTCPETDVEPLSNSTAFRRTPPHHYRPCNAVDVGFRNVANCPLHAYYVTDQHTDTCGEQFKFHLGVESSGLKDYVHDWTSQTKYEGTFMGHSFVFRLASNPDVLVDTHTLQPTRVQDCPMKGIPKTLSIKGQSIQDKIPKRDSTQSNSTTTPTLYKEITFSRKTNTTTVPTTTSKNLYLLNNQGATVYQPTILQSF